MSGLLVGLCSYMLFMIIGFLLDRKYYRTTIYELAEKLKRENILTRAFSKCVFSFFDDFENLKRYQELTNFEIMIDGKLLIVSYDGDRLRVEHGIPWPNMPNEFYGVYN